MTPAARELTRSIQGLDDLCAALDRIASSPHEDAVIHGDVRWDNVIAAREPGSRRWTRLAADRLGALRRRRPGRRRRRVPRRIPPGLGSVGPGHGPPRPGPDARRGRRAAAAHAPGAAGLLGGLRTGHRGPGRRARDAAPPGHGPRGGPAAHRGAGGGAGRRSPPSARAPARAAEPEPPVPARPCAGTPARAGRAGGSHEPLPAPGRGRAGCRRGDLADLLLLVRAALATPAARPRRGARRGVHPRAARRWPSARAVRVVLHAGPARACRPERLADAHRSRVRRDLVACQRRQGGSAARLARRTGRARGRGGRATRAPCAGSPLADRRAGELRQRAPPQGVGRRVAGVLHGVRRPRAGRRRGWHRGTRVLQRARRGRRAARGCVHASAQRGGDALRPQGGRPSRGPRRDATRRCCTSSAAASGVRATCCGRSSRPAVPISTAIRPPSRARSSAAWASASMPSGWERASGRAAATCSPKAIVVAHERGITRLEERLDRRRRPLRGARARRATRPTSRQARWPTMRSERGVFLEAAGTIARAIAASAVWDGGRCNWVGASPRQDARGGHGDRVARGGPVRRDERRGAVPRRGRCPARGRRAAAAASRRRSGTRSTYAGRIGAEQRDGLYLGPIGVAYAAARVAGILDSAPTLTAARELLRAWRRDAGRSPSSDVMSGCAGAVVGLVALADLFEERSLLAEATRIGDELLARASREPAGWSWAQPGRGAMHHLCGFSHGAAGIGLALAELFAVTGDDPVRGGRRAGLRL